MQQIVECIPNFSEGQNLRLLEELANTAQSVAGVALLNYSADAEHNRSVYTLAGSIGGIEEVAFLLCEKAVQNIDLRCHKGAHPRMGALDVLPFVPISGVSMAQCVALSARVGQRIAAQLGIPVFLYEESATGKERQNLANIRRGQFEGMTEKLLQPQWQPNFGENVPHKSAGVVAVGARGPLIAFNVNLATSRLDIAQSIAGAVRAAGGGLPFCKAIALAIYGGQHCQVSMNLTNYRVTPMHAAFSAVKALAAQRGVAVLGSQLVGLAPAQALADSAAYFLQLEDYCYETQVLEKHFWP